MNPRTEPTFSFARRRGLSLAELLVVMAVIAALGVVSATAYGAFIDSTRLAVAENAVVSSLQHARTRAMADGRPVLVAYRTRLLDGRWRDERDQAVEAVLAGYAHDTSVVPGAGVVERFVPLADVRPRRLPRGVHVAAPFYAGHADAYWVATSEFAAARDAGDGDGVVLAVLFAADGSVITQRAEHDAHRAFVDFDADGTQRQGEVAYALDAAPYPDQHGYCRLGAADTPVRRFFCQAAAADEPFVTMAPYLAVFDAAAARDRADGSAGTEQARSQYLTRYADRIHFNRYSGVVMR